MLRPTTYPLKRAIRCLPVIVFAGLFWPIAASADMTPVSLRIENMTTGAALRCQLVLAHFVTLTLVAIPAGHGATVDLLRAPVAGTLFLQRNGCPSMAVENILCGLDGDWADTRNDLNLTALRSQPTLRIECAGPGPLHCRTPWSASREQEGDVIHGATR